MQAKHERRQYKDGSQVWVGKYRNSQNFPHWHYDCELVFVEKGSLNIFCNGHLLKVSAGRTVFIDSEQIHFLHALTPDATVRQIIFSYDLIKDFAENISLVSPLLSRDYGTAELYFTLANEFRNRKPFYANSIICAVQKLMIEIFRNEPFGLKEKKPDSVDRLKPLMRDIEENFEFYTLDKAAEFMIMNPAYFSRLFHKLTGIPFSQYLNSVKVKNAVELLKTRIDLSVTEISAQCGFATIRNFNRIFKKFTGYTPSGLPKNFVMKENFTDADAPDDNPTIVGSELLESSDDF